MKQYSVGMTTCSHRLEKYLKPLITEIKRQRPNIEIVLAINGEHKKDFDEQIRQEFLKFCQEFLIYFLYSILNSEDLLDCGT